MKFFESLGHQPPSNRLFTLIGVGVVAITFAAASLTIWDLRQDAISTYQQETENLGSAFAEQTSRTLQAVELILSEVEERVRGEPTETPEQFESLLATQDTHRFLADRIKNLPQADLIGFVGANGNLVNSSRSWPVPVLDLSDRD
jgi:hypothetical protein